MKIIKLDKLIFTGLALVALVFVLGVFVIKFPFFESQGEENTNSEPVVKTNTAEENTPTIKLADSFFDSEIFFTATEIAESVSKKSDIRAIIVPHHLVASEYIAKLIREASGRTIKNVVIIGPNHENLGTAPVSTLEADWETPFGTIKHDHELIGKFLSDYNTKSYPEIFTNEHSVGGIMPFVKHYFDEARIMPIIISSYAQYKDMETLSQWLIDNLNDNSLIIYSLDFSHYLTKDEADKNDEITKELILNKDIGKIFELNNDFVDAPGILALSLMYGEKKDLKTSIVYYGNSYDFATIKPQETTSYFAISFADY